MKRILYAIALMAVITACASKKSAVRHSVRVDSIVTEQVREVKTSVLTDTTRTEAGETIVTEILFADDVPVSELAGLTLDGGKLSFTGIGGRTIRGIRQTASGYRVERKGLRQAYSSSYDTDKNIKVKKREEKKEKKSSSYHVPMWVYVLAIIVVAAIVRVLYVRIRGGNVIPGWIARFFSGKDNQIIDR